MSAVRAVATPPVAQERPLWRAVAIPSEHGGWGLTLEPVLLGLLVAFSWGGVAIGTATLLAFLLRTPVKLALVDRRRGRSLPRTRVAWRFAISELLLVAGAMALAIAAAGWTWLVPFAAAAPLFAVELWFDIRSRGPYLVPELCGAIGITAAAAAIVIAGGGPVGLALAVWTVLGARALASVPFVRAQVVRLRGNAAPASTDGFQVAAALTAVAATFFDHRVVLGAAAVVLLAAVQAAGLRRPVPPIKVLGLRQMAFGLAVVSATAIGALVLS